MVIVEGWCTVRKESKKVLREGGCRHDLVRNQSNTHWACSKCGHVFVGGNAKPEEGLTRG